MMAEAGFDEMLTQLEALITQIGEHFEYEVRVLQSVGFPDSENHAQKHKELLEKAQHYKASCQTGDSDFSALLSFIVDDVISEHIAKEDLLFFPYTRLNK